MTPFEKAKAEEDRVNYCDECEQFQLVGNAAYCKADGKLIHPIMMIRGQGTGPAWNCKKRKPLTNADRIRAMTDEEMAVYLFHKVQDIFDHRFFCCDDMLAWLKQEVDE